jgi:sialate O-acetylesterase
MDTPCLKTAPIFSNNMVLQRDKDVPVWGTGINGRTVNLIFMDIHLKTIIHDGQWEFTLPPRPAGVTGTLEIFDEEIRLRFDNVVFGDVWLAGGQSNMELSLRDCSNGTAELAASSNPNIRFYQVIKQPMVDDTLICLEQDNHWHVCGPDTAGDLSAVAYFYSRKLNADLGVPIGIINCNWGGTSISAWMDEKQLRKSVAGRKYIDDYTALINGKTDEEYDAQMKDYLETVGIREEKVQNRRTIEPDVTLEALNLEYGEYPWPPPVGTKSPLRPSNLYHSMVCRAAPYCIKGFLYYQGESDEDRAMDYDQMMYYLIDQWRTDWKDDELPFLFVQLPMYASKAEFEEGLTCKDWPLLRENQYKVSRIIAHTGMAVIIDCGEFNNIHPLNKQTVGFRLALQALKKIYGLGNDEADGPVFARAISEGKAIRVYFSHAEKGLEAHGPLEGFDIAGSDGIFYPASAQIEGSTVLVYSAVVPNPERVRYCWIKYGPTPLFGKNGLPAMPFRSYHDL